MKRPARPTPTIAALGAGLGAVALAATIFGFIRRILSGSKTIGGAIIHAPTDDTTTDEHGAVRSIQGADIDLPEDALREIWNSSHLERLARTYWSYLTRVTLGLIRVEYSDDERRVVLIHSPLVLLRFQAPEYEMNGDRGIVRWRIERGLLVAKAGRGGDGYLEIDVRRLPDREPGRAMIHVDVEVANFYPAMSRLGRIVYENTQSRIHVIVTHGFLRRLVRRELDESVTGRYAQQPSETPEPIPARDQPVGGDNEHAWSGGPGG